MRSTAKQTLYPFKTVNGEHVKDKITGFKGVVIGLCSYITGCNQALVQPPTKKLGNEFVESRWIDEDRLEIIEGKFTSLEVTNNGPDKPAPRI